MVQGTGCKENVRSMVYSEGMAKLYKETAGSSLSLTNWSKSLCFKPAVVVTPNSVATIQTVITNPIVGFNEVLHALVSCFCPPPEARSISADRHG